MPGPPTGPALPPWGPGAWDQDRWRGGRLPRATGAVVLALLQVLGTLGAAHGQPDRRALDALGLALLLAGPAGFLLLTTRRRVPAVTVLAGVATAAYLLLGYPYGPVFASLVLALVVAVVAGYRSVAWAVAGALLLAHGVATLATADPGWSWVTELAMLAWALLVLAFAEVIRVRRERALSYRQTLVERRRREAGEERLRIAQELHDVVAHHMSLINVQASVALHLGDHGEAERSQAQDALRVIKDASKEALTELRSLITVLRQDDGPAPRRPVPSLASLEDLVERSRYAGLDVAVRLTGAQRSLPVAVELAAYRIIQEAITNVVRHAHAGHAVVTVDYGAEMVTVVVDDDGSGGAALGRMTEGTGIRGMRERVAALRGTLEVEASPLGGVRVAAELPTGAHP